MIFDSAGESTTLDFSETKSGTFSVLQPVDAKSASDKFIEFSFQQHKDETNYTATLNFEEDECKIFNLKRTKAWATENEREEAEL
jgi:hypothetical protein